MHDGVMIGNLVELRCRRLIAVLALLAVAGAAVPAIADDESEHLPAPADVVPLDRLLQAVSARFPGRVLKVELEYEDDVPGWIYELKLLTPEGYVLNLHYDARSLELHEMQGYRRWRDSRAEDDDDDDDDDD